jgi:four helix bundle protein
LDGKPFDIKHRCYHFSKDIILFISEAQIEKIHFSIFDRFLRSATSIGANVVEESLEVRERTLRIFIQ